jgi:hypothetical protein
MIMTRGTGSISNYGSYTNNCTKRQLPYRIPVTSLSGVQLYINIGGTKPDAVQYELIHTCGGLGGTIETLSTSSYVVGQDTNGNWYGVFKNFTGATPTCFVIAITLTTGDTDTIYFSDEYCVENVCESLTLLKGCYGHLDNKLSYDCEGIYFGTTDAPDAMGDLTIVYKHELYLRGVEVTLNAIKNSFKQGRTRNFRTEKEKIYQFMAELVPEWYISEIDAVFYRGEVFVDGTHWLVNDTQFEKIEECKRQWKPTATFKESCYQSFSCETDPCGAPPIEPCCDPLGVTATVEWDVCCTPQIISATVEEVSGGSGESGGIPCDDIEVTINISEGIEIGIYLETSVPGQTAHYDWGDGFEEDVVGGGSFIFPLHLYATGGTYVVRITAVNPENVILLGDDGSGLAGTSNIDIGACYVNLDSLEFSGSTFPAPVRFPDNVNWLTFFGNSTLDHFTASDWVSVETFDFLTIYDFPNLTEIDMSGCAAMTYFDVKDMPLMTSIIFDGNETPATLNDFRVWQCDAIVTFNLEFTEGLQNFTAVNLASYDGNTDIYNNLVTTIATAVVTFCPLFDLDIFSNVTQDAQTKYFNNNNGLTGALNILGKPALIDANFEGNGLSATIISNVLIDLDTNGLSNGSVDVEGNSVPNAGGLTAKANLIGKGWTVITD